MSSRQALPELPPLGNIPHCGIYDIRTCDLSRRFVSSAAGTSMGCAVVSTRSGVVRSLASGEARFCNLKGLRMSCGPGWSPEGAWLYFASDRGGALNLWRYAINEDPGTVFGASQPVPAPSRWVGHLAFSLDGSKLAFFSFAETRNLERFRFDAASATVRF